MRLSKVRLTIAGALALIVCGSAHGEDLLAVYQLAQQNDPTFEAARYALEATRQKIPEARAGLLPVLSANGNDSLIGADTTFTGVPTVSRNIRSWTWAVQLTQPLIHIDTLYAYSESKFVVAQAEAQYAQAEQALILRVAQAYFDVLAAEQTIIVAQAQVSATSEQLDLVKHGLRAGTHAVTDVDEAQSRYDLARSQHITAMNDLEDKQAELEKIVGQPSRFLAFLGIATVTPKVLPENSRAWIDEARINNPAVREKLAALSAAQADIQKNRAMYLPTVDLIASKNVNSSSGSLITPNNFSTYANSNQIGLQLNVPLYEGGATHARVDEAIANMYKAKADLEAARRQATTDARQAYTAIVNGLSQIDALSSAVTASRSSVQGNKEEFKAGLHMNIDVLNAEQQLYTAQRDLTKARYDTLLQGLKLKAAAGVLNEADIVTFNTLLVH
ncbi:MAG: TolC family outer membrane protein [Sulfuriferula sp.]